MGRLQTDRIAGANEVSKGSTAHSEACLGSRPRMNGDGGVWAMNLQPQPVVRLHLWLETEKGVFLGLGRLQLLQDIQSGCSLKGAADRMRMSYRAAWGKIKKTEQVLGIRLIEKNGGNRRGYQLTAEGKQLASAFERWFQEVEAFALQRAGELLPCKPKKFEEPPPK
jgi:molybdate transport system regulatory protein